MELFQSWKTNNARDEVALQSLRPELSHLEGQYFSDVEAFQNRTLRPIIKMQHDSLLMLAASNSLFVALRGKAKTEEAYKTDVIKFFKLQSALKNQLTGMIIGHFTMEEWKSYTENSTEINKRIIQMIGERVSAATW